MKYLNLLFLLISFSLISQKTSIDNELYEGNEKVKKEDYLGAEMDYRLALTRAPQTPKALFNLGNTQYQANAYDEAAQQFFRTQKFSENKTEKHAALHNMGNVYMKKKEYEKAVESYKNALRNNPSDNETRYNYALAKSLLEDENKNNKDKDKQN
ncbi:MAG: Ca-activated chloride channel family protein, partial [Candidatus Marivariicella framensis]